VHLEWPHKSWQKTEQRRIVFTNVRPGNASPYLTKFVICLTCIVGFMLDGKAKLALFIDTLWQLRTDMMTIWRQSCTDNSFFNHKIENSRIKTLNLLSQYPAHRFPLWARAKLGRTCPIAAAYSVTWLSRAREIVNEVRSATLKYVNKEVEMFRWNAKTFNADLWPYAMHCRDY